MIKQLVIGKDTRQFFEPKFRSPGSLKKPSWPNNKNNAPIRMIAAPMTISSLPICCGPKSI